ncbi:MAG: aldo/keto reductase [Pseudomonadota bacterium]
MDRVRLTEELELSRIAYGMWRLCDDPNTSPDHVRAKIEACLEQGITTMDQADIYGGYMAEEALGACLKDAPALRDRIELVTKCDIIISAGRYEGARVKYYDTTREHIVSSVEHSLRLMATDRIDLLLIHRPDPLMDPDETGAALDEVVKSGKVNAVGVSNFRPHDWTLLQSAMSTELCTNQIEMSVLANDAFTNGDLAFLQERGVVPMAWSPLAGGALFKPEGAAVLAVLNRIAEEQRVDAASVAVAWLLHHPARILPVLGTNSLDRIRTMGDAKSVELSRVDWFEIYTAARGEEVA